MLSADNLCKQFGPRSGPTKKKLIVKNVSRRQEKHEKVPSMQRVKEGFDHPRILTSAFNAYAHNIYTPKFRTEAYWIVASAC